MTTTQKIIKVVFDKNMNLLLQTHPVFTYLFPNIRTLTSFNTFLAKNKMLEESFLTRLKIEGVEHHVCYKYIDLQETFEFNFFLLDDEWMIINPTGRHDIHDQLTKVLTQRSLIALIEHEIKSSLREKQTYTAVIIDIAHLTDMNETFGYLAGDRIIQSIAKFLQECSRGSDPLGRYKGDKFVVMLHQTNLEGGLKFIKKFEKVLESSPFHFSDVKFNVRFNYALTSIQNNETTDTLLQRLDDILTENKKTSDVQIKYFTQD